MPIAIPLLCGVWCRAGRLSLGWAASGLSRVLGKEGEEIGCKKGRGTLLLSSLQRSTCPLSSLWFWGCSAQAVLSLVSSVPPCFSHYSYLVTLVLDTLVANLPVFPQDLLPSRHQVTGASLHSLPRHLVVAGWAASNLYRLLLKWLMAEKSLQRGMVVIYTF